MELKFFDHSKGTTCNVPRVGVGVGVDVGAGGRVGGGRAAVKEVNAIPLVLHYLSRSARAKSNC